MPAKESDKPRKKVVVEEVTSLDQPSEIKTDETPEIKEEVSDYHVEPGVHEEPIKESVTPAPVVPPTVMVPQRPSSGPNPLIIIIPGVFLLGALLGGIIFYQNKVSGTGETPEPTQIETASVSPAPTPTSVASEVDLTKYQINILNGSGIKGEAGKVQDILQNAGFKVSGTGNAANYSYTETIIQTRTEVSDEFITQLRSTLGKTYKVATKNETLPSSSKDSVVVIVGSTKK